MNDRQLRLFACACSRELWRWLTDNRLREAIEAAELYADGLISRRALAKKRSAANDVRLEMNLAHRWISDDIMDPHNGKVQAAASVCYASGEPILDLSNMSSRSAAKAMYLLDPVAYHKHHPMGRHKQIIGDMQPVEPLPAYPHLVEMSREAYHQRTETGAFNPILLGLIADALEDAQALPATIAQLRAERPFYRSFWVVDLLLGKITYED